jgi:hypothetical protein
LTKGWASKNSNPLVWGFGSEHNEAARRLDAILLNDGLVNIGNSWFVRAVFSVVSKVSAPGRGFGDVLIKYKIYKNTGA